MNLIYFLNVLILPSSLKPLLRSKLLHRVIYFRQHSCFMEKRLLLFVWLKKSCSKENNFRPVALTSIVMKSLERIMVGKSPEEVEHLWCLYQFAYNKGRNSTTHLILKHLEDSSAYARLMVKDFSSTFKTLLPQILLPRLKQMNVKSYLIKWYCDFLIGRQQQVKVKSTLSGLAIISTGAP